ncbi:MAG TPA: hypothetical protein VFS52_08180 [Steroidobacteraceae bacterium]|jgi:hypothetical protein|nr:hypothetical protein [Steroidobacteraceae bacterium]
MTDMKRRTRRDALKSLALGGPADVQLELSGYHHNVAGDFVSLGPAIYAAGHGEVRVRNVRYQAL